MCPLSNDLPLDLRMRRLENAPLVVAVQFSMARVAVLSRAELEVGRLAASGHTNETIAALRGTSARTVANQMAAILRKLSADSRRDLATIPELAL